MQETPPSRSGFRSEAPVEPEGDAGELWEAVRGLVAGSASQSGAVDLFELKSVRGRSVEVVVRDPSKAGIAKSWVNLVQSLLSKAAGATMQVTVADANGTASSATGAALDPVGTGVGAGVGVGAAGAAPTNGAGSKTLRMVDPAAMAGEMRSAGARAVEVDAASRAEALEQPLVKKAIDLFNARLVGVEDDADEPGTRDQGPGAR
ncbi:MAG: hypothetical protein ACKVZJ_07645 [Phycisphaerales bacterium]